MIHLYSWRQVQKAKRAGRAMAGPATASLHRPCAKAYMTDGEKNIAGYPLIAGQGHQEAR